MKSIDPLIMEKLETLIGSMGYELVGCEMQSQGRQMVLRIYLDSPNGIGSEDCSRVSHQVSAMLDVESFIQSRYVLEVSSPGIDRPLFTIDHFRKYVGSRVKIRLYTPIHQRRQFKGLLVRVEAQNIYLLVENAAEEIELPFSAIEKANLVGDIRL